jgi:hypothetical protein
MAKGQCLAPGRSLLQECNLHLEPKEEGRMMAVSANLYSMAGGKRLSYM